MSSDFPRHSRFWFVQPEDLRTTLSGDYHELSKISEFRYEFGGEDPKKSERMLKLINAVAGKSKKYTYCPQYPLEPANFGELEMSLGQILERRRSRRKFIDRMLPGRDFATLLVRGAGLNGQLETDDTTRPLRTYPSGGGLFPLEIYALVFNVQNLPPGLYHFDVYGPALSLLSESNYQDFAREAFMNDPMVNSASAILLITALFQRSRFKYGERSYRFILLESGHLVENLILVGEALGISVVPIGGFLDRKLERLLDVDGIEESIVYTSMVGST